MVNCWPCCISRPKVSSPSHEEPAQSSPPPATPTTSQPKVNCWPCCTSQPKARSPSPRFIKSMKVIIQQLEVVHPTDQIDPLIDFIDYLLPRIKASPEEASASSFPLDSVASNTRLAANMIDKISTEAEKFKDLFKEMGNVALSGLKMVGEAHLLFLGLSVAACALERCVTVRSTVSDCIELLQTIASLAKYLKEFRELVPGKSDKLCEAVQIIVEGAVMCCDYMSKRTASKLVTLNPFIDIELKSFVCLKKFSQSSRYS